MKKVLIVLSIILLLVISACVSQNIGENTQTEQEPTTISETESDSSIMIDTTQEKDSTKENIDTAEEEVSTSEEPNSEGLYTLKEGQTVTVDGKAVTVTLIDQPSHVEVDVDGVEGTIENTKQEEIINELRFNINKFDFKSDGITTQIFVNITPIVLEDNQYVLYKNEEVTIGDRLVTLLDSRETGHVDIKVSELKHINSMDDTIKLGETKEINGLKITILERFYKIKDYAVVEVERV